MGSPYLPPGTPTGNSYSEATLVCENEDCDEQGVRVTATVVYERDTGASYLADEEADTCEFCGQQMADY